MADYEGLEAAESRRGGLATAIVAGVGTGVLVGASIAYIVHWRWGTPEGQVHQLLDRIVGAADRYRRSGNTPSGTGAG